MDDPNPWLVLARVPGLHAGKLPGPLREDPTQLVRESRTALTALGRDLLAQLVPDSEPDDRPEARVRKMSAWAAENLDKPLSLQEAAAHVGLSSGRARHLFVESTGAPVQHRDAAERASFAQERCEHAGSIAVLKAKLCDARILLGGRFQVRQVDRARLHHAGSHTALAVDRRRLERACFRTGTRD